LPVRKFAVLPAGENAHGSRQVPLGAAIATVLALLLSAPEGASAQIAVSANDNKVLLVDGERTVPRSPETNTVTIIDLSTVRSQES
jgi:hypothetical protein